MKKVDILFCLRFIFIAILVMQVSSSYAGKNEREFYKLTVYHFKDASQEKVLDDYFQKALLPALHKMGIAKVGVFKSWANDTAADKLMYVFYTIKSPDEIAVIDNKINADQVYQSAGSEYINAPYNNPPYTRMEIIILHAFPLAPKMQLPELQAANKDRVYELRSYESATEKIFHNKVQMFNQGNEIDIFKRLNFNAVFYSEVYAGSKMPNLMYMTTFNSMKDRDTHWKAFGDDPAWKKLSGMPEYQNNVQHIDDIFLYPTDYSDF